MPVRRLDDAGLGMFCPEVHSHKTKKAHCSRTWRSVTRCAGHSKNPATTRCEMLAEMPRFRSWQAGSKKTCRGLPKFRSPAGFPGLSGRPQTGKEISEYGRSYRGCWRRLSDSRSRIAHSGQRQRTTIGLLGSSMVPAQSIGTTPRTRVYKFSDATCSCASKVVANTQSAARGRIIRRSSIQSCDVV